MLEAKSQLEQKLQLTRKIQNELKRKKVQYLTFIDSYSIQLPPISQVFLSFPSADYEKNSTKAKIHTSPAKKMQLQLERALQQDAKSLKNREISKILFSNPVSKRYSNDKVIFQSTLFVSLDNKLRSVRKIEGKLKKNSVHNSQDQIKQNISLRKEKEKLIEVENPLNLLGFNNTRAAKDNGYPNIFKGQLGTIDYRRIGIQRGNRLGKQREKNSKGGVQNIRRFSPWVNKELEEELIV